MPYTVVHNPFATQFIRPGAIPFIPPASGVVESIVSTFQKHHCVGQILGPHGSGKTSLTYAMESLLEPHFDHIRRLTIRSSRDVQIDHDQRTNGRKRPTEALVKSPSRRLLIVDGIEKLTRFHRWCFRRNLGSYDGLLLTTHVTIPGFPTIYRLVPTPQTLHQIVQRLAPDHSLDTETLNRVFHQHHGNLRESLFTLYDSFSSNLPRE